MIAPVPSRVSFPTWDPGRDRIAVISTHDGTGRYAPGLYVVRVATGDAERVVDAAELGDAGLLDWSPVADRLLMWRNRDLWVLDLSTRAWARVTDGAWAVENPRWSPDGEWVYFTRVPETLDSLSFGGLYLRDLLSGVTRRVLSRDGAQVWPVGRVSFSPDGQWLTYSAAVPGPDPWGSIEFEVFALRRDGSERRQLTSLGGEASDPQWLPSGREIVFTFASLACAAQGYPARHTWGVAPDGSGLHQWDHDLNDVRIKQSPIPAISGDGKMVAYAGVNQSLGVGVLYVSPLASLHPREVFRW